MDPEARPAAPCQTTPDERSTGWMFEVGGTGFKGTFQVEIDNLPDEGHQVHSRSDVATKDA